MLSLLTEKKSEKDTKFKESLREHFTDPNTQVSKSENSTVLGPKEDKYAFLDKLKEIKHEEFKELETEKKAEVLVGIYDIVKNELDLDMEKSKLITKHIEIAEQLIKKAKIHSELSKEIGKLEAHSDFLNKFKYISIGAICGLFAFVSLPVAVTAAIATSILPLETRGQFQKIEYLRNEAELKLKIIDDELKILKTNIKKEEE